jgi:hypothetical protein
MSNIIDLMLVKKLLCDNPWCIRNYLINPPIKYKQDNLEARKTMYRTKVASMETWFVELNLNLSLILA